MFFKAKDLQLDRIVGLKTLRPELLADAALRARLQTEAKSLARLVHQHIANVLHYLVVGENNFIVMEYVEGLDLAEIVRKSGLVPLDRLGPIVRQICEAISYAHSKDVIHRDLKPSNIMITEDWEVKVTDFGIAKILGDKAQTRTGMAAGSLHYMAPEQIRASGVDARTDIYQLGATLYELTAGRRPFVSDSEYELMTMHLQDIPEPPSSVNSRVSPEVDAVILKALAKNPDDRYQNAMELNAAYQAALGSALAAGAARGDSPTVNQFPAPSSERPTTVTPSPEDKTTVGQGRVKPKQKQTPREGTVTPEWGSPEPGKKPLWMWLAGAGAVVVALLLYFFWPAGDGPPTGPAVDQPDTTATVVADSHAPCTLVVHAQVPAGIRDDQVDRATLSINHPVAGMTRIPVEVRNGVIDHTVTVGAISEVSLTVQGFDQNEDGLFTGIIIASAPAGERVGVDVPLAAVIGLADPEPEPIAETPPEETGPTTTTETTTTSAASLLINVTPFDARSRVQKVWIDDEEKSGAGLFSHKVSAGRHTIRFLVGSDLLTDTVTVGSSGETEMNFFIGSGRGKVSDILEGPHEIAVSQAGYRSREGPMIVRVKAGDNLKVSFKMVKR
jgi:hypothetical protein